jgi:predicted nuclease of predicted toxin-antitoxin system
LSNYGFWGGKFNGLTILEYARKNDFIIVTFDAELYESCWIIEIKFKNLSKSISSTNLFE